MIVKVKGDPDNPRSKGYLCRKGQIIVKFQHHEERLTTPLKKTASGFVEISWEKALSEIGEKFRTIVDPLCNCRRIDGPVFKALFF